MNIINNNEKKYYCKNCDYGTCKPSDWEKHINSKKHARNGEKKSLNCSICNYESSSHWNLKIHVLSNHSTKEERMKHKYYCAVCDQVIFCSTYMNTHINGNKHKKKFLEDNNKVILIKEP